MLNKLSLDLKLITWASFHRLSRLIRKTKASFIISCKTYCNRFWQKGDHQYVCVCSYAPHRCVRWVLCVSVRPSLKSSCVWLNRRKWLWLPQEMGRGNPGASTSLAMLEPQDDSPDRKREGRVEGRVEGGWEIGTAPRFSPLELRQRQVGSRNKDGNIFVPGCAFRLEMKLLLRALSALLCFSLACAHTLDPAGKNVCQNIR